jgi:hypothetical protein
MTGHHTGDQLVITDPVAGTAGWQPNSAGTGVPVGCISAYIGTVAPPGWLLCDGSTFSPVQYPELAMLLGNVTTPDLRGLFLRGTTATRAPLTIEEQSTARPTSAFTTDSQGAHTHTIAPFAHLGLDSGGATGWSYGVATATVATSSAGAHVHRVTGGGDAETRPTSYTVNYFIRIDD